MLRLEKGLRARGVDVCHDLDALSLDAVLLLAGTRNLAGLWRVRRRGIPVVQRLDGINWIHRRRRVSPRYFVRAEYGNLVLSLIRSRLATRVVYQSRFVRRWWEAWYGPTRRPFRVIYNGVDLDEFSPQGPERPPEGRVRLLVVEGSLAGGLDIGLRWAMRLAESLAVERSVELVVAGRLGKRQREALAAFTRGTARAVGQVPREDIPALDRSAHLLYSADLNAACPNTVIEAMACGLPVVGFDTGALSELVTGYAGRVAPYGGDPWRLDPADVPALVEAAQDVLSDLPRYRVGARARAEEAFGLDRMVEAYLEFLLG